MKKVPKELIREVQSYNCVLFTGSGITTEQKYSRESFLDHICKECKYPKKKKLISFPEVMQYYCEKVDNNRKNRLIREIIEWIEDYSAEGERNRVATMFYRYIARIPYLKTIVTTNWDPFCERTLNILVPMVEDQDIPFWDENKRQVLKIHGCVTRPQTIIATLDDYEKCMQDRARGAVFTRLRDLMATKTFIFAGFSIGDPDFQLIYDEVISNLGEFRRGSWVIDPSPNDRTISEWEKRGVKIINISGITFARDLVTKFEKEKVIPAIDLIAEFSEQRERIVQIHMETSKKQDTSGGFASSMYQDGLLHAIEEIVQMGLLGRLMDDFKAKLNEYSTYLERCRRRVEYLGKKGKGKELEIGGLYTEIAYASGWIEPLMRFISNNKRDIPAYFNPISLKPVNKPVYFY